MMSVISRLRDREREGFTLIELLVVVLIIGILAAIAIPTFLGQRRRAQDRSAQSDLRNTLVAAKTIYTDKQSYAGATAEALRAIEPALSFEDEDPTWGDIANGEIAVRSTEEVFEAVAVSESGAAFAIRDRAVPGDDPENNDLDKAGTMYGTLTVGAAGDNVFPVTATYSDSW